MSHGRHIGQDALLPRIVTDVSGRMNWDRVNRESREMRERSREQGDAEEIAARSAPAFDIHKMSRSRVARPSPKCEKYEAKMSKRAAAEYRRLPDELVAKSPRRAAAALRKQLLLSSSKGKKKRK